MSDACLEGWRNPGKSTALVDCKAMEEDLGTTLRLFLMTPEISELFEVSIKSLVVTHQHFFLSLDVCVCEDSSDVSALVAMKQAALVIMKQGSWVQPYAFF